MLTISRMIHSTVNENNSGKNFQRGPSGTAVYYMDMDMSTHLSDIKLIMCDYWNYSNRLEKTQNIL